GGFTRRRRAAHRSLSASFWSAYLWRLGAVALALALLYAAARRLRNLRLSGGRGRCVTVVETTVLSPHAALHLLRVGARYLLLGSGNVRPIGEVEPFELPKR